jgi:predicted DNA-binding protein (UPF0251 family)
MSDNPDWWSEIERLYYDEGLTQQEIADRFGKTKGTVYRAMDSLGISPGYESNRKPYCMINTGDEGYVRWRTYIGDHSETSMTVHRLLAIAEHGADAVAGSEVHHKNGIRWDNRPENIELKSKQDHMKHHAADGVFQKKLTPDEAVEIRDRYANENVTYEELADDYGISRTTVGSIVRRECWKYVGGGEA